MSQTAAPTVLTLAIPNRNGAAFLAETLASLERNRPYVRWWLQDSCSSDSSVEIARRYAGSTDHVQVEKDRSQSDGLNRAIGQMGGDIIGFLNSDDCLADGAAEAVLAAFAADPALDIVYGEVEWIDAAGRTTGTHRGRISSLSEVLNIYGVWWNHRQWVQPEVFWRRSLWDRVGPLSESLDLAFDYEYWVRCFEKGVKVQRIPQVLARFRLHAAQKSTDAGRAAKEIRSVVSRALSASPSLSFRDRWSLTNRLGYDSYWAAQKGGQRRSFLAELVRHPGWLTLPEVRSRLIRSGKGRISKRAAA